MSGVLTQEAADTIINAGVAAQSKRLEELEYQLSVCTNQADQMRILEEIDKANEILANLRTEISRLVGQSLYT